MTLVNPAKEISSLRFDTAQNKTQNSQHTSEQRDNMGKEQKHWVCNASTSVEETGVEYKVNDG